MAITANNIKLMRSEVLLDTENGGGRMTANEVTDGASNNLFADVSEMDRTYGRISLRKCFAAVNTTGTDSYLGAHAIVMNQPGDPNVSVTMFTTKSWTDQRVAASNNVQSYLAKSVKWPGQLLGIQLQGQRSIQLLLRVGDTLPKVGQSLVLIQDEGKPTEISQFVRIQTVTSQTRQFTVVSGNASVTFTSVMVTCTITSQLLYTFIGPDPSPVDLGSAAGAICRDTQVANAANYYGVASTTQEANPGDVAVRVASIYSQLVPSAQSQTPLTNLSAAGTTNPTVQSASALQTLNVSITNATTYLYVPTAVVPGTWSLGPYSDDRQGNVVVTATSTVVGSISYHTNTVLFNSLPTTGTLTMSWMPAGVPILPQNTATIEIDQTNRVSVFAITLTPPPAPRRLQVSYMSQGNWYTMTDQGGSATGVIKGSDPAIGAGTIIYATGTVTVTLGSLPDDASAVMFSWASPATTFNRSNSAPPNPYVSFFVTPGTGQQLVQNGLTVTWPKVSGGVYTATLDPATQTFSGDGTGYARWANGQYELRMAPSLLPAGGTIFTLNYNLGTKKTQKFTAPARDGNGKLSVSVSDTNLVQGSVKVTWNVLINDYETISNVPAQMQYFKTDPYITAQDNGSGVLRRYNADGTSTPVPNGAVNYATGAVTFLPDMVVKIAQPVFQSSLIGYMKNASGGGLVGATRGDPVYQNTLAGIQYYDAAATYPNDLSGTVEVEYMTTSGSATQQTATMAQWNLQLMYQFAENIVPGSVMFAWGGKTYYDDGIGNLFMDFDPTTKAGTLAGSISYSTGVVTITQWGAGGSNTFSIRSLLTTQGGTPVDFATFRIPAAPVVPSSLQIQFSPVTGGTVTVTANSDGSLSGNNVFGTVNYQTGVVNLRFGRMVTAAGNESAIWYNANAVTTDGKIFKPYPVFASTIQFNAVAYSYLPLDSSILGLDPVRLPTDGRVPVFQKGYVVVVHHTAKQAVSPASGLVVNVNRVRVAAMRVIDSTVQNPVVMSPTMYTTDLDAGTLTFNSSVSTSGMTAPFYVENRVEDMALASDVQITGQISLTKQLTHKYPAGETKVSSALIMGDLQARMSLSFTQITWSNTFTDAVSGSSPSSAYNFTTYPLQLSDQSAIQERWALVFTDAQNFRVIGESVGQVATGTINADCIPTNPATSQPYFTLAATGWGGGWAAGNVLRFNTIAANYPIWLARTVLQSTATGQSDSFRLQIRGDVDA